MLKKKTEDVREVGEEQENLSKVVEKEESKGEVLRRYSGPLAPRVMYDWATVAKNFTISLSEKLEGLDFYQCL